jgi:hypothetical protein
MNQHIADTAKAWGIKPEEMDSIFKWVGSTVPKYRQSRALTTLLRRNMKNSKIKKNKPAQVKLL